MKGRFRVKSTQRERHGQKQKLVAGVCLPCTATSPPSAAWELLEQSLLTTAALEQTQYPGESQSTRSTHGITESKAASECGDPYGHMQRDTQSMAMCHPAIPSALVGLWVLPCWPDPWPDTKRLTWAGPIQASFSSISAKRKMLGTKAQ